MKRTEPRRSLGRVESALLLLALLLIAIGFRTVGLDWDEGTHLHPDERFLTMVVGAIESPGSLALYLDTSNSPLNPYNRGYGNFFYGTLPIFLVRFAGEWTDGACAEEPSLLAQAAVRLFFDAGGDCSPGTYTGYGGVQLVGRVLSTLADLGALVFLFFMGRRLYGPVVGLLAVALGALAALPIQHSHFFIVENFAHFFTIATLYFAVRAAQTGGWTAFALAGLMSGLAVTCKMSIWPTALIVALAGALWWLQSLAIGHWSFDHSDHWSLLLRLSLAAILFLLAFRLAQPYAFQGPGFFEVRLNPQWVGDMGFIRRLMSGEVDTPPGHQWTARTPIVFPWVNMVVWGLGIPLGLAVWGGWALVGLELARGQRRHVIPWVWGTLFFLYQATQWVKSMRYLLPVYYVFVLFGAYALWRLGGWALRRAATSPPAAPGVSKEQPRRSLVVVRRLALLVPLVVLGGALFWALAFTRIYTRTTTRIAASHWIYANVPAGATLHYETPSGPAALQIAIPVGYLYTDHAPLLTTFTMPEDGVATEVTFNHLGDPHNDPDAESFRAALAAGLGGETILAEAMGEWAMAPFDVSDGVPSEATEDEMSLAGGGESVEGWGTNRSRGASYALSLGPVALLGGQTYTLISECTHGGPVQADTSVIANEHWDDALPLRIEGRNPFGGLYRGLSSSSNGQMQNYNEDTPEKRAELFTWLDEADYIFLSSNRLYASIARLPARYPLTTAYYRALFAGELGFELVADFTSYPALSPFQFPDQESAYPLREADYVHQPDPIKVPLPPAEEAFSVYDHPRVLIFRKTAAYSRQRIEAVLGGIDVTRALGGLKPIEVTAAPDLLEFDLQTWADQQAGGTWSEMFNRGSLLNRYPGLAAVAWWAVVTGLGWLAFPLLSVALPRLHDRGYGLARVLGLLLLAYLTWLAASLHLLPNTRGTILRGVLLLALVGGGVGWFRRDELRLFLRRRWRLVLLIEGFFALLYVVWIGVRLLHPDLWHPVVGGEKPMVFAYLNAVMKSTWFPPYNPWFSGSTINYYYFGFVIIGTLIKLMGTVPAVAYNLAVPLLCALTGVGAFSVAYNLFGGHRRGALLAGVMALVFTVLLGNLGVVHLIRTSLIKLGGEPFLSTIPGFSEAVTMFRGLWEVIAHGAKLPLRIESWYWHPTRIIPAGPGEAGPITEFPAFTFLYADMHAHMFAFPLMVLALAVMVYWVRSSRPHWASLLIGGSAIGALYPTNTWNYPAFLILGLVSLALGSWELRRRSPGPPWATVWVFAQRAVLLVGLTFLPYLPYHQHYAAGYTSIELWHGSRTPFDIYLWVHSIMLFPLCTRLVIEVRRLQIAQTANGRLRIRGSRFGLVVGLGVLLVLTPLVAILGYEVALVAVPVAMCAVYLVLVPGVPTSRRLLWLMVGEAMAICLGVEIVVLKGDVGRMNTVFKFYLQAWMLLSVAAGVSLAWVRERARRWREEWRKLWWIGVGALVFGGALFLPYGVRARAIDRLSPQAGLTLDGMAFMEHSVVLDGAPERDSRELSLAGDYAAIRWMQDNIQGSPVILEGLGYREYLWANRVSIYTGLPTVIGWRWHQVQQRLGVLPEATVNWRRADVTECYDTTVISRGQEILTRYGVRYVYVGEYERAYYNPMGLAKFDHMVAQDLLRVVYDAQGVRIYEVLDYIHDS